MKKTLLAAVALAALCSGARAQQGPTMISPRVGPSGFEPSSDQMPPVPPSNFVPYRNLNNFLNTASPTACVIGDSIGTLAAQHLVQTDVLAYQIYAELASHFPNKTITPVNLSIGGQSWTTLASVPQFGGIPVPTWYFDTTLPWLPFLQAQNCTSIFFTLGGNFAQAFGPLSVTQVMNIIAGWTTSPAAWATTHTYAAGAEILDSNGMIEVTPAGGVSGGGAHPTWPSVYGGSVVDNTVTWERVSTAALVVPTVVPDINLFTSFRPNPVGINGFGNYLAQNGLLAANAYLRSMCDSNFAGMGIDSSVPVPGCFDLGRYWSMGVDGFDFVAQDFYASIAAPTSPTTLTTGSPTYTLPFTNGDMDVDWSVSGGADSGSSLTTYALLVGNPGANAPARNFVRFTGGINAPGSNRCAATYSTGAGSALSWSNTAWVSGGTNEFHVIAKSGSHGGLYLTCNGVSMFNSADGTTPVVPAIVQVPRFASPITPTIDATNIPGGGVSLVVNSYNVSQPQRITPFLAPDNAYGVGGGPCGGGAHPCSKAWNDIFAKVIDATLVAGATNNTNPTNWAAPLGIGTTTPNTGEFTTLQADGLFTMGSGMIRTVTNKAATGGGFTFAGNQDIVCAVRAGDGGYTATLITSPAAGRVSTIKDCSGNAATKPITVSSVLGTIDGASTFTVSSNWGWAEFFWDGTNWHVLDADAADQGAATYGAATSSVLGLVKPDGTTIPNTAGAISVAYGTAANTAAQGNDSRILQVATNTANIATNTSSITANTTNIASNTASIAAKPTYFLDGLTAVNGGTASTEQLIGSIGPIPAGILGTHGAIRVSPLWSINSSSNSKTLIIRICNTAATGCGSGIESVAVTTSGLQSGTYIFRNNNSASSQLFVTNTNTNGLGTGSSAPQVGSVNTAAALYVNFIAIIAGGSSADTVNVNGLVEVLGGS